ncbi:MAG: hypothetical protein V1662_03335 [Candidatus Omnitrophota bacterium]
MVKRNIIVFLLLLTVFLAGTVFAETYQITSYYPSPYGSYRDLETKKSLAVGNISSSAIGTVGALAQGEIWVEDSVIFKGQASDPAVDPNKAGEVIYNSTQGTLKYANGTAWARVTSICYVSYTGSCLAGYNNMGTAGDWGYCNRAAEYIFYPPGGACPSGWTTNPPAFPSGTAIICCQ